MAANQTTAISLLLVSVDGNGHLRKKIGDDEAGHVIDRCLRRTFRCIEMFDGRVVTPNGQRIVVLFEAADTACRAALEIQENMAALPPVRGLAVDIQVACASGPRQVAGDALQGEVAPRVDALMEICAPGQVLVDTQTYRMLSPAFQRCFLALEPIPAIPAGERFYRFAGDAKAIPAIPAASLPESENRPEPQQPARPVPAQGIPRLRLFYAGAQITLEARKQVFTIGRGRDCHLTIAGPRISRLHALIQDDGERFFLRDQSTNGTFLKIGATPEIHLRRSEFLLRDKGIIGIADSTYQADTEQIGFQLL